MNNFTFEVGELSVLIDELRGVHLYVRVDIQLVQPDTSPVRHEVELVKDGRLVPRGQPATE